jgi:predicted nuclease of predicted toxin-antitoxin system
MRFKVDENLPAELVELLRDAGWDAMSVLDENLSGTDDDRLNAICTSEGRVLLTFDRGFGNIRTFAPHVHPGFIVFRLGSQEKPHVLKVAEQVITMLRTRACVGELWIVEESRIRVRKG